MTNEPTLADALLPCPFCGCDDIGRIDGPVKDDWVSFACRRCHTTGPHDYSDRHAIAAWNRRAELDRAEARVAKLEAFVSDFAEFKFDPISRRAPDPQDDLDPLTEYLPVEAWQDDARAALADKGGE